MTAAESIRGENSRYQRRSCPSCLTSTQRPTVVASKLPAERTSFQLLRDQWCGFFKDKSFFSYARCVTCDLLYAPVYFTSAQLAELYRSMPNNMSDVAGGILARTQYGYFRELRQLSPLRGQFLEVGPDVGLLTQYCARLGDFSKLWLFEPNVTAHAQLVSRLGSIDREISTDLLDLSNVPDRSIDVVAMVHVLDHLIEPVEFLRQVRTKLAADAIVLIVTHDESSLLARAIGTRWPAYCLQHPHLFKPKSIQRMLNDAGYTVVRSVKSVNYFPMTYLIKHLAFAISGASLALPSLERFTIPLRLGNLITMASPH